MDVCIFFNNIKHANFCVKFKLINTFELQLLNKSYSTMRNKKFISNFLSEMFKADLNMM